MSKTTTTATDNATFDAWRATGRDVADLAVEFPYFDCSGPGRDYRGGYIEKMPDGRWYVQIERSETIGTLEDCERVLFAWASAEGCL